MQDIQIDVERENQRFQSRFKAMNFMWAGISLLSIVLSSYFTFSNHPGYVHDWHAPLIILLATLTLSLYFAALFSNIIFKQGENWPPPFRRALLYWCCIAFAITLLSLIDANFTYSYFIALGLCFALFPSRIVIVIATLTFFFFCLIQGILFPPFTPDKLGIFGSIGITFLSMVLVSLWIQHLIYERYTRNALLEQLSRANAELQEAHRRLAESAAQEQELAVLRERTRLAREMHDTLGHALVLISIKLEAAQRLRERDPERSDRELESTKEIARSTMNELRASISNLRSPALQREPACRAISRYAREMAIRTGLQVDYDLHPDIDDLPEQVEETLWKVGQEALTNIEKHAHARQVLLHISRQDSHVVLRIADDGVGLPSELCEQHENGDVTCAGPDGHYGISGMVERVENAGGRISIRPGKTRGTTIEVELPLVEAFSSS